MSPDHHPDPLRQLTLDQLRHRTSMKWRQYPPDVLPLWVAEMDVPLAEPIITAVGEALALGDLGYHIGAGYAEALGAFARDRWGWDGITPECSVDAPDVMLGIVEVLKVITQPGDAVVVNSPVYPPFFQFITHLGRRVVQAPLAADHRISLATLEAAFTSCLADGRAPVYLLCSPHNPMGTVHTRAELVAATELANRFGVRIIADEIHAPLTLPGARFVPFLSVPGSERGFAAQSASKAWNLPGLKAALVIAGPDAIADLHRIPEEFGHGVSHVAAIAHIAALREGGPWLDALLAGLDHNRRLLGELLAEHLPKIRYRQPEAGYLTWLDCRELGVGVPDEPTAPDGDPQPVTTMGGPAALFLSRGRVALNAGTPFGLGGAGHVRLNLATSPEILTEAVRRMATAVA